MVVLEDGNPIFDIPTELLPLDYSGNFPVNYYLPEIGITYKWLMAEWKAIVIIYAKENPDKRWLRFYWWVRNLQDYISSDYIMSGNTAASLAWGRIRSRRQRCLQRRFPNSRTRATLCPFLLHYRKLGWTSRCNSIPVPPPVHKHTGRQNITQRSNAKHHGCNASGRSTTWEDLAENSLAVGWVKTGRRVLVPG